MRRSRSIFVVWLLAMLPLLAVRAQDLTAGKPALLPSKFVEGARIYLKMSAADGDTVLGFCDSGGGFTAIYPDVVERLQLQGEVRQGTVEGAVYSYIPFAVVVKDNRIPPMLIMPFTPFITTPSFEVPNKEVMQGEIDYFRKLLPQDAFLGQFFWMGKAWTFDYLHQQVWVNTPIPLSDSTATGVERLGFKKDAQGHKTHGHPSMQIVVEGETIDVLFDIGASLVLSPNGRQALNTTEPTAAGSFIAKSIFDKWHTDHPDWKWVERGELNSAGLIEVPRLTIAGRTLGPVWFAMRPDVNWSKGMISSMDKVVKGALGGSAFKYLKVTIDYNQELAKFE